MNDQAIRFRLLEDLNIKYPNDSKEKNLIVNEMAVCRGAARVDVAVVNGVLHGYEIKSSEDTLVRLKNQLNVYEKCFDYISVVTTEKHLSKLSSVCPISVGISEAFMDNGVVKIVQLRKPTINKKVEAISVLELTWKDEAIWLANEIGLKIKLANRTKKYIYETIAERVNLAIIQKYVRTILKQRKDWKVAL